MFRDSVAKSISGNTILDPEDFSLALEFSLTLHYLQVNPDNTKFTRFSSER